MKTNRYYFLIFFLLFAPLFGFEQQYELMRVAKIDIVPVHLSPEIAFNPNSVRARMHTKIGNFFSQNEFDNDLKMLAEEYDQAHPCIEVINNELHIKIEIWVKPTIRMIHICGNENLKTKSILKELDLECGIQFSREILIQAIHKVRLLYVKKGFFESDIDFDVIPIEETSNEVDIQVKISEGRAGRIKKICFEGLTGKEEEELLELMMTKKYNFCLSWFNGRGVYHPDMMEQDRLQIIYFLQNHGYADATVQVHVEDSTHSDTIFLVIKVDKCQKYEVGNLSLSGNTLLSNQEIWDQFTFGIGSVYSPHDIRTTIQAITDLYGCKGYIDTYIDVQLFLREESPIYDLSFSVQEGEQYYIGLIKVFGNCHTQTRLLLHESLLCPGEVFDNRKLEATEARLANTGYFSAVNVYAVRSQIEDPRGQRNYRDVYIEVEETDTGNLGIFAGFSSLDRIFGGVEITERNFNIAGITRVFHEGASVLRGGGEFAHAKVNVGNRQTNYTLQWTKPYFLDTPWIVGIDLEKSNNRALSRAYDINTYGGNIHGTYLLNPFLKYDLHYRARHTSMSIRDDKNPLLVTEGNKAGFISAVGVTFIYDSTDSPRRASCGLRSRLMYEIAGVGGNFQFMRFSYLNSYYYPVFNRGTLKFRAEVQFVKVYGSTKPEDLPLSERLFLGGETTVRGYRPFIIGPQFASNEPRGGLSSYLLSEEYQHNLIKVPCIDGFVFVDAGYVSFKEFTVGRPSASIGLGVRVEVMRNMPLMLGYGWPIGINDENIAQRFFFAMGGSF